MIQSVHAILLLGDRFILQLRDNKRSIAAPGKWSLFGGQISNAESALEAIQREISEELSIQMPTFDYLWSCDHFGEFERRMIKMSFFVADIERFWPFKRLMEGQRAEAFSYDDVMGLDMPEVMLKAVIRYHQPRKSRDH